MHSVTEAPKQPLNDGFTLFLTFSIKIKKQ